MKNTEVKKVSFTVIILLVIAAGGFFGFRSLQSLINTPPNIIFILTDDLDLPLLPYMENTNKLIGEQGATFTNYFVTSSACCPSRATTIRGQYPHNTNILENSPGFRNFYRNNKEDETIAVWLQRKGYRTALTGKYLNGYPVVAGRNYVPPGWDDWHVFFHHDAEDDEGWYFYNYTLNENGALVDYGYAPEEYSTDVIARKSIDFIATSIADRSPFFIYIAAMSPHGPSTPAPRHENMFLDLVFPKKDSFNEEDISDKPSLIQEQVNNGDDFDAYDADALFIKRVQTMQATDEMVGEIVRMLEQSGQLDNTYIIFTSDNGFHMGEHGLSAGKMLAYEEDIHVPLLIRGPGIAPNTTVTQMTANIDIAPSLAHMAGAKSAEFVDGRSFVRFFDAQENDDADWRKALLIETGYLDRESRVIAYRGVRTENYIYLEYENGELEFYDLIADPYEMNNIAGKLDPATLSTLHSWLEDLKSCQADGCRTAENALPEIKY
ncbi:MAG TPA: hypothetical protein DCX53_07830 [Anaerolineae bacterium]|nr:hypothetical protein [Anaerolineae bacterium]